MKHVQLRLDLQGSINAFNRVTGQGRSIALELLQKLKKWQKSTHIDKAEIKKDLQHAVSQWQKEHTDGKDIAQRLLQRLQSHINNLSLKVRKQRIVVDVFGSTFVQKDLFRDVVEKVLPQNNWSVDMVVHPSDEIPTELGSFALIVIPSLLHIGDHFKTFETMVGQLGDVYGHGNVIYLGLVQEPVDSAMFDKTFHRIPEQQKYVLDFAKDKVIRLGDVMPRVAGSQRLTLSNRYEMERLQEYVEERAMLL
jgi:hypothetical protein